MEHGVYQAGEWHLGLFSRSTKSDGGNASVAELRNLGVKITRALKKVMTSTEEVVAVMLVVALDIAHKSVTTVSRYFFLPLKG